MHWYREGTRQRSRILYVFRSPGGVRVGRESLEPEILRDIEANYPDIAFDWKAVLDNKQIVETAPEMRRPRKRRRSEEEAPAEPGSPKPHSGEGGPKSHPSTSARGALSNVEGHGGEGGLKPPQGEGGPKPQGGEGGRPAIPSAIEGATPDEQTAFLARWYPIVRDRIPQRTTDPARREALLALAERMNPTAWTDADQIVAGLQQAGEALERLSRVFARRRRRPRRAKSPDRTGTRESSHSEPATPKPQAGEGGPKPHPSTPARGTLSDVEGQAGEGGQPSPDTPQPKE